MCALFGSIRDISVFRYINRELMGDIINQQVAYYKYVLEKTKTNIYGESSGGKFFNPPVLFNCLIERYEQENPVSERGVEFNWGINVAFLMDDLKEAQVFPEVGDVIMYEEGYFEVNNVINNQLFIGKDPDYPNEINPLNPGLGKFGWNVSIICKTVYVPKDKLNIAISRL